MAKQWTPIYLNKNQKFEFIDELSSGVIPALVVKKAFSLEKCKKITEKILDFNYISSGPGIVKKIGESLNSFINQKGAYFEKTKLIDKKLEQHFLHSKDPRISMQNLLSSVFAMETRVAKENNSNYSNGVFRFHGSDESFKIHRDSALIIMYQIFHYNFLPCYIYSRLNMVVNWFYIEKVGQAMMKNIVLHILVIQKKLSII